MRVLLITLLFAGCTSRSTGETEVGVLVCKIGLGCADGKGVQKSLYPPGSTNFFAPFVRDFYRFDTKMQNLEMTRHEGKTARGRDDLQFKTTDGNVSVHARKLEEAGYLSCKKSFEGRMPKTEYSLTAAGKRALEKYLGHMEALIKATRGG